METVDQSANQSDTLSAGRSGPTFEKPEKRRRSRAVTYPRKRAAQACHTCRLRRTKCDNTRPSCASCLRLDAECIYRELDPSSFDSASLAILKRIDDLESLIQTTVVSVPSVPEPTIFPSTSPFAPHEDLNVLLESTQWKPCLVNVEAILEWPVFEAIEQHRHWSFPAEEENDHSPLSISVEFDIQSSSHLIERFFEDIHIFNPILEENDVRDYMRNIQLNGIGWDSKSCLMLLIYALGSISTPFVRNNPGTPPSAFHQSPNFLRAESYFLAAQKRLGMMLVRNGVVEAQCFFLAGVYLMTTLRPILAWRMFVQGLACCQGLQSRNMDYARSAAEWNPRQRIYWTCFKSELELRLELNLPQQNALDLSYPTMFPSPPDGLETKLEPAWYFYLAEIALRRLKNRILSSLYQSDNAGPGMDREEIALDFEEQTDAWFQSLPEVLAFNFTSESDHDTYEPFRFILKGHFLDCQEIMYWHFVVRGICHLHLNSNTHFLQKGLQVCVDRIQHNQTGFHHRHHGTWLMIRSCTRSALVLIAARKQGNLHHLLPLGWEKAIFDVEAMLSFWKDESTDVLRMWECLQALLATIGDS